jgi:hypothetical protein
MTIDNSDHGEVCDAYVPPHLQDSEVLRQVIGSPMEQHEETHDPLCRQKYQEWESYGFCPDCDLINKVIIREKQKRIGEVQ